MSEFLRACSGPLNQGLKTRTNEVVDLKLPLNILRIWPLLTLNPKP